MFDWFMSNWLNILLILGVVLAIGITVLILIYAAKWSLYLWHKRVLLVDRRYYSQMSIVREKMQAEHGDLNIDQLNSLFEALATVVDHKDKVIKATGESLKKLDTKFESLSSTIAMLEEANKELRNRDAVINKLKSIKLLLTLVEEIDKFSLHTKENYLEFIQDNIKTVLIGLGAEPFDNEFLASDELLKYYKLSTEETTAPYKVDKEGYLVRMPDNNYVVKQAIISSRGV